MEKIIKQLKKVRIERGLSQSALGKRVGLPQNHISKIESGKTDPRTSSLIEISRSLGLELMLVPREMLDLVTLTLRGESSQARSRWEIDDSEEVE